jgi:hypothetical protein
MESNMFGWNSTVDGRFNYNERGGRIVTVTVQRQMIERLETANAQMLDDLKTIGRN